MLVPLEWTIRMPYITLLVLDLLYRIKLQFSKSLVANKSISFGIHASLEDAAQYDIPNQHVGWTGYFITGFLQSVCRRLLKFEVKCWAKPTIRSQIQRTSNAVRLTISINGKSEKLSYMADGKPWVFCTPVFCLSIYVNNLGYLGNQPCRGIF